MQKKGVIYLFIIFNLFLAFALVSAEIITDDLHLNIQTTNSTGGIVTGTFVFVFNITNSSDCAVGSVVYSNSTSLTTDSRGIISYYLNNVSLDYNVQYYLCYYRDGALQNSSKIARIPYAFRARNVTLSGVEVDSNFNLTSYNISTTGTGFFGFLGTVGNRISRLFVQDIDASGNLTVNNIGVGGITNPLSVLHIPNDEWISANNSGNNGIVNILKINSNDQIELGSTLNIGSFEFSEDSGLVTFVDMPVSDVPASGTPESYVFKIDGENLLTVYAEADSSGGIQNKRIGINTIYPQTDLHVNGSILANGTINATTDVCIIGGNCLSTVGVGTLSGAGTYGYIPMWNGTTSINNSIIYQNETNIGINTTTPQNTFNVVGYVNFTQNLTVGGNITFGGALISGETATSGAILNEATSSSNPTIVPSASAFDYGLGYGSQSLHLIANSVSIQDITPNDITFNRNVTFMNNATLRGDIFSGNVSGSPAFLNLQSTSTTPNVLPNKDASNYGLGYGSQTIHLIADGANVVEVAPTEFKIWQKSNFTENVSIEKNLTVGDFVGINLTSPTSTLHLIGTFNTTSNGGSLLVNSNGDVRVGI